MHKARPRHLRWFTLFILSIGCSRSPTSAADASASSSADADPRLRSYSNSLAYFQNDRLLRCADIKMEVRLNDDAGLEFWETIEAERKASLEGLEKGIGGTPIKGTCAENFGDRVVLGECTMEKSGSSTARTGTMNMHIAEYTFARVGASDQGMQECLKLKGQWKVTVSRGSPEWAKAKAEHENVPK